MKRRKKMEEISGLLAAKRDENPLLETTDQNERNSKKAKDRNAGRFGRKYSSVLEK